MAEALIESLPGFAKKTGDSKDKAIETGTPAIDMSTIHKLSYGLFVLTANDGGKDNGCIINTVMQITETPLAITIAVNKANKTHDMIINSGLFAVSILSESAPFGLFEQFGFHSGSDTDKFAGYPDEARTNNGIRYLTDNVNCVISVKVTETCDYGTHIMFIGDVTQAFSLSDEPSVTYKYYFDNIKPKPKLPPENKAGYICKICAFVYEGDILPDDYICPLCKHGASDFERIN